MSVKTLDAPKVDLLRDGRMVAQAWLASRGLICLVALLLAIIDQRPLLGMVGNWDAVHFGELARSGYGGGEPKLMAFFPGLPALMRAGLAIGLPTQITGIMIATVCSAIAAIALLRMGGPWVAIAWLFAPTAVFTTLPYTESLFCAAAFWAWERARSDKWVAAAGLAAIACTVRISGLFLIGALFIMIITTRKIGIKTGLSRIGLLLIPAAVLLAYAAYLYSMTGSWTAWYSAQSTGWAREMTWPWESFMNTIPAIVPGAYADHPGWAWMFRGEMVSMFLGIVVTFWCLWKRMWAEASWVGVQVLAFSLSYWFFSVNRAILLWFPLWMMLAQWGAWKPKSEPLRRAHRMLVIVAFAVSTALMLWWSWSFYVGRWAS